jgi:hypothetical protein
MSAENSRHCSSVETRRREADCHMSAIFHVLQVSLWIPELHAHRPCRGCHSSHPCRLTTLTYMYASMMCANIYGCATALV